MTVDALAMRAAVSVGFTLRPMVSQTLEDALPILTRATPRIAPVTTSARAASESHVTIADHSAGLLRKGGA